MESFPFFFKIRSSVFMCIMLFSFLWLVLLCVEIYSRWSVSDEISHSLMVLFVLANTITLIMLPMLILVQFRIWLDAARLFLLFVLQVGSAAAGTYWSPKIQCPGPTPDDIGICQLIGVYTMIACWIVPATLIFYSVYFAVVVYLQSRIPVVVEPKQQRRCSQDPEMGSADSLSLWRDKLTEILGEQGSSSTASVSPRSLVLPTTVHARQSSLPQSFGPTTKRQSSLPNAPMRQSTMPPVPQTSQYPLPSRPPMSSRHCSLPPLKHDAYGAHLHPLFVASTSRPSASASASASSSQPQTPSSYSHSNLSPVNTQSQPFSSGPGVADARYSKKSRRPRHLSMMTLSSSPRGTENAQGSPANQPTRARLSKPLPAHLL